MKNYLSLFLLVATVLQQLPVGYASPANHPAKEASIYDNHLLIRGGIPVYVHPDESGPVREAVQDLLRDLKDVFGQASALVDTPPGERTAIVVATGDRYKGPVPAAKGWEAHQVYVDGNRVVLNGADMRGT